MRLLLPFLMKKAIEKAQENLRQQQHRYEQNKQQTAAQHNSKQSEKSKHVGEYIDFEEID